MDRRAFLGSVVAGATLLFAPRGQVLQFYPNTGKQEWAVLFGSRYRAARDAGVWVSEGMGGIAAVFDASEDPDLSSFKAIVVGFGIYQGALDKPLETYPSKNAARFSSRIAALYIVCGQGDTPKAQDYVNSLATVCGVRPKMTKVFPTRPTIRLPNEEDKQVTEGVAKKLTEPYQDSDRLQRKDCLSFGADILAGT